MEYPKTLQQAIQYFSDEDACIAEVAQMRWPEGKPVCPKCASSEAHYWISTQRRWKCRKCRHQFSVKQHSIFEDSPIPLSKWLLAMWMIANCRNGVSSYEIHRAIGVTQKSAWFMLHRIRLAMKDRSTTKIGGPDSEVEADETLIGGKISNMTKSRRAEMGGSGSKNFRNKTLVIGAVDRTHGTVRAEIIPSEHEEVMRGTLEKHVKFGSTIYTDGHRGYLHLRWKFNHDSVDHATAEYVRGRVHTNSIESFWALLKRNLAGTYVAVEPEHLSRYLDEQMFRFNSRKRDGQKISDGERFKMLLSDVAGRRLTFAELTNHDTTPF
jgi:transposase-like protein